MRNRTTALTLTAIAAVGSALASPAAAQVPSFDVRPGCRAAAESGLVTMPDIESCVRSEMEAKNKINAQWKEFAAVDRTRCVETTRMGGPPSYIEVLTCLEMARDVRRLPKDENVGNRGLDGSMGR